MKNKFFALVLLTHILFCQFVFAQTDRGVKNTKTEQKIALIIGNTNYDNSIGRLTNPVNDANDMAESLKRLGFTLVGGKPQMDVNRKQMLQLIRDFGSQIKQGGIGFFYFSGHGVQVNKENYIIPITDALQYEDDAETEAVKVDMVAKEMELAGNRLNILVLDACRNNGLQKRTRNTDKGLTEPNRKPEGTFIAFSAGDGQTASDGTGENGLFTQELLKNLETPNVRLDDIFRTTRNEVKRLSYGRQVPVLFDSTSEAFVLNSKSMNLKPTLSSSTLSDSSKLSDKIKAAESFFNLAKNCDSSDLDCQLTNYNKAIDLNPKYLPAYFARGLLYSKKQELSLVIEDFSKVIEFNPENAYAYYNRGIAYANKNLIDLALKDFTKAIENDSKFIFAFINRGDMYKAKADYTSAIRDFTVAIELSPIDDKTTLLTAYNNRHSCYLKIGDRENASKDAREIRKLNGFP